MAQGQRNGIETGRRGENVEGRERKDTYRVGQVQESRWAVVAMHGAGGVVPVGLELRIRGGRVDCDRRG